MTLLDGAILVALALALVRGYTVGGVRQITSIVGMVLAFIVSVQYMRPLGVQLEVWGVPPTFAELAAFTTIFLVIYLGVAFAAHMAERFIKALRMGVLDNLLGSVLSGAKVLLLLSGVLLLLARAGWPAPDTRQASTLYEPVRDALPTAWEHTAAYMSDTEGIENLFPDVRGSALRPTDDATAPQIRRLLPTDLLRFDAQEPPRNEQAGDSEADNPEDDVRNAW